MIKITLHQILTRLLKKFTPSIFSQQYLGNSAIYLLFIFKFQWLISKLKLLKWILIINSISQINEKDRNCDLAHSIPVSYPYKSCGRLKIYVIYGFIFKYNQVNCIDYKNLQNHLSNGIFCCNCTIFSYGKLNNQQSKIFTSRE